MTGAKSFFTEGVDDIEKMTLSPMELGARAPCKLKFVPSKKIMVKLMKRATQIKDEV